MQEDGQSIKEMVEENKELLRVKVDDQETNENEENQEVKELNDAARHWDRYLLFLDHKIARGLVDAVHCRYGFGSFLVHLKKVEI